MEEIVLYLMLVFAGIIFWCWIIYRLVTTKKKNKAIYKAAMKKKPEDLNDEERRIVLYELDRLYSLKQFTPMEYDTIKSRYLGKPSLVDIAGKDVVLAAQISVNNKALAQQAKKAETKTIIKDAAIGGIVAGPAGAVVGAVVGKNKVESNSEKD
ncbi:MAG: hypothetical protein U0M02_08765 [Acutalibacteraceae bacterium]|nr:hypothetical protein [Acutalibacteraceae bacterium]